MNKQIARFGVGLVVCYVALFAMLNWVQVIKADDYNNNPFNTATVRRDFNRDRGTISTADGALLAISEPNEDPATNGDFERVRRYPEGDLFGHVTGFFSFWFGSTGVERTYTDELAGQTFEQQVKGFADLFVDKQNVGNVNLSVRKDLQEVSREALGNREGSVVAVDVKTGELLSFWSFPSYDPNAVAVLDKEQADINYALLNLADGNPLLAHQYQDRYFPGSTFKVVTASTGLQTGKVTPDQPVYPVERSFTPPGTDRPIFNFGASSCGGALFNIVRVSCNTAFARMGSETIGANDMINGSQSFGFNDAPPIDLPGPASSAFPTNFTNDIPKLAQSSIGQNDVQASPLQMALVAAGVANQGKIMKPHVMTEIRDANQNVVTRYEPGVWKEPLSPENAEIMKQAMIGVVQGGTGRGVAIPGFEVGAKTGTAQLGTEPPRSHLWMIAFGGPPGDPQVAVAAVVLDQPGDSEEATGGAKAGPIVRKVLEAALRVKNGG
jgi:peptidoglycan glycosyltransferase